jgi:glycosyltransferase involved in cell wall biosynthesis
MHVLVVALHRPLTPTGVCRYAANLSKCLVETNVVRKVTLVTGSWQQHYFKEAFLLDSDRIDLIDIDIKNTSLSRNLWFLFGLPKLVKELSPDIVHLSFPLPFLRSRFSCPVIATIHDLYPYQFPENFGYRQVLFNRLFLQQCIRGSDGLACVSQTTLEYLTQYFPEVVSQGKKTAVTYNFVDFKQIEPTPPKDLQGALDTPFILCVGQHRKNKNLDLLIKAYSLLLREHQINQNTRLVLVGSSGPETEYLTQLIHEYSLETAVDMLSAIEDDHLCWLYQNCNLFVIPSSLEGFCIPLVEALYFSCKVVCSDIPIFREIGSPRCTYFDLAEDPVKHLAHAMIQSLQSSVSDEGGSHLRFSKAAIAEQCSRFYLELM